MRVRSITAHELREAFLVRADRILIGGAMCFPFFRAQGHDVGDSLCEDEGGEPGSGGPEQERPRGDDSRSRPRRRR